jgi:hypothetical protein
MSIHEGIEGMTLASLAPCNPPYQVLVHVYKKGVNEADAL